MQLAQLLETARIQIEKKLAEKRQLEFAATGMKIALTQAKERSKAMVGEFEAEKRRLAQEMAVCSRKEHDNEKLRQQLETDERRVREKREEQEKRLAELGEILAGLRSEVQLAREEIDKVRTQNAKETELLRARQRRLESDYVTIHDFAEDYKQRVGKIHVKEQSRMQVLKEQSKAITKLLQAE